VPVPRAGGARLVTVRQVVPRHGFAVGPKYISLSVPEADTRDGLLRVRSGPRGRKSGFPSLAPSEFGLRATRASANPTKPPRVAAAADGRQCSRVLPAQRYGRQVFPSIQHNVLLRATVVQMLHRTSRDARGSATGSDGRCCLVPALR
jgi:hypothetical protein